MKVAIGLAKIEVNKEEWNSLKGLTFYKQVKILEDNHSIKIKAFLLATELDSSNWEIYYYINDKRFDNIQKRFE